jgi:hypothetical protein
VVPVRCLYSAETQEEYHLRKAAFEHTVEANLLAALAAKVSGRPPTQKPQYMRSDRRQDNAKTVKTTTQTRSGAHFFSLMSGVAART